jgi:DNA-binding HxlR family transcriptional regulator
MHKRGISMDTDEKCNVALTSIALNLLGGKWNLHIISVLYKHDSLRYTELQKEVAGITGTMLTRCLKELAEYGLVSRIHFYMEVPPRVEYGLTESSKELVPLLKQIGTWADQNLF